MHVVGKPDKLPASPSCYTTADRRAEKVVKQSGTGGHALNLPMILRDAGCLNKIITRGNFIVQNMDKHPGLFNAAIA
jgi:hypothetical protein